MAYAPLNNSEEHLKTPPDRERLALSRRGSLKRFKAALPFGDIVAPSRLIFHFPVPFARPILLGDERIRRKPTKYRESDKFSYFDPLRNSIFHDMRLTVYFKNFVSFES